MDENRKIRQSANKHYHKEPPCLDWIDAPKGDFDIINSFLCYIHAINSKRPESREHMKKCGVNNGIHWRAGHSFSSLKDFGRGPLEVTDLIVDQNLSLALHNKMSRCTLIPGLEGPRIDGGREIRQGFCRRAEQELGAGRFTGCRSNQRSCICCTEHGTRVRAWCKA